MKKKIIVLAAIFILPLAALAAQQQAFTLLSFDMGSSFTYAVGDEGDDELGSYSSFGINLRVTGPLSVGFVYRNGADPAMAGSLFRMKYDVTDLVRLSLGFGNDGTDVVTAMGLELIPFRRAVGGLFTEFKMLFDYDMPVDNPDSGHLSFGMAVSIGL